MEFVGLLRCVQGGVCQLRFPKQSLALWCYLILSGTPLLRAVRSAEASCWSG